MGEQKALVLAASQERAGGGLRLPQHRGPWTQSTSAPGPLAGSDVNRLPASVLPLHHKYPLSRHGHQQRVFSKDHWRGDTPSPTREREGSTELVGYSGLSRVTRTGGIEAKGIQWFKVLHYVPFLLVLSHCSDAGVNPKGTRDPRGDGGRLAGDGLFFFVSP